MVAEAADNVDEIADRHERLGDETKGIPLPNDGLLLVRI
jgi:hypothetical protein